MNQIKWDLHTHTIYSHNHHGKGTIEENVQAAIRMGLTKIGISDHGPGHVGYGILRKKIPEMRRIIDELQDRDFVFVYHNCSNAIERKIDAVIGTGAKMFHFGDKADMWELLHALPNDVIVMGNISPSAVFMCDSTDKMAKDTQALLRKCMACENFMISSGCDIPANTPLENIDKFFEVIKLGYHKARLWNQISRAYPLPSV